jgi:GT2 family glycosyltransferase
MEGESKGTGPMAVAVVLTWNDTEMAARCIRSVQTNTYPHKAVVLVDNGTDPPGCPILKDQFPTIETVQLSENTGFTGGCNRGMERALDMGANYVFLLNNDTIVHEDAMAHLVDAMEAEPKAAMATAVLLFPGDEKRIQFYRGELQRNCARHVHPGEGDLYSEAHQKTVETDFAPACAVLFRAAALRDVGLFDEGLFTNWEDYDLVCRFQDAGWKMLSVGHAEVIHAHGQTTGRISPFITYFFTRNRLICLFRHGRLLAIAGSFPFFMRTTYWQIRNYGFTNWPAHWAFAKGLLHFFLGIRGKGSAPAKRSD